MIRRAFISQSLTKSGRLDNGVTIIIINMFLGKVLLVIVCFFFGSCLLFSKKKKKNTFVKLV